MTTWIDHYRRFGERCERRNGRLLTHVSTVDTVRDLDLMRRRAGERKLNYVGEMLHLVDIGAVDPLELDSLVQTTLRAFVPVFGPLQMTDLIGHDTLRDISNALYPELATDRTASRTIEEHVADGRLGVKSGRGFYDDNEQRVADLASKLSRIARQLDSDSA